jgi:hypothetical protein
MKIIIEDIPHKEQRYETCGDWYFEGDTLIIKISAELSSESKLLITVHELVEVILCSKSEIDQYTVDLFDINYKGPYSEPGEDPSAPYYEQHIKAEVVERILANFMNINWKDHEKSINSL